MKMDAARILYYILPLIYFTTTVYANEGSVNNRITKTLVKKLKEEYGEVTVRPVHDYRNTTYVYLRMLLYELIDFNENHQKITLRSNFRMMWTDEFLRWDPMEWDNISTVTLHIDDIWRPDLDLAQNVDRAHYIILDTYVLVDHTGTVNWYFPVITTSACKINIVYFPYDVQECNVTFYPWTLDSTQMRLLAMDDEDAHQQLYVRNGVWNLAGFRATNESIIYKCCPHPFDEVVYTLDLARETAFFTTQIVVPSIFLTVLMLISFWLHPDSGEKISLTVTNLLALILFQQLVAQFMPPTGEPRSIVVTCFFILIALSACSVILTIIVLRVYHKDADSIPPSWTFVILRIFINRNVEKKMSAFYENQEMKKKSYSTVRCLSCLCDLEQSVTGNEKASSSACESATESTSPQETRKTIKTMENEDELNYTFLWRHLALAIDRAFGIILSVCMFGCLIYALEGFSSRR